MEINVEQSTGSIHWLRDSVRLYAPIPATPPRPTLSDLQGEFPWVKGIERDTSPVAAVTFKLGAIFSLIDGDDAVIGCEEFENALLSVRDKLLGYRHGLWLVAEQSKFSEMQELEGKVNILLPGLIVVDTSGDRRMFFLGSGGTGWWLSWRILNHRTGFTPRDLIAYSG